jgi:hypothetical protein
MMTKRGRVVLFLGSVALASVPLAVILTWFALGRSDRVIWQDCQPPTINYGSFDPYCVSVIEGSRDWSRLPFTVERRYYLFIGRGTDAPAYGHYLDFTFVIGNDEDPDAHIQTSKVHWTQDGFTFVAKTGHSLFVPAKAFIGGR